MEARDNKKDLLEFYRHMCLERGASIEVGPAYYKWFIDLNDEAISELIRVALFDRSAEITRWMTADPQMKTSQDIFDYIETMLLMIARGFVQITSLKTLGCFAPTGPEPSPVEEQEIDHRILASRCLFADAISQTLKLELDHPEER